MIRRDPFQMFREFFRDPFAMTPLDIEWPRRELESMLPARVFSPDIEVKETHDRYLFCADVPGMRDEDVEVSVSGNRLTISGRREETKEEGEEGAQYHVYERSYGSFTRSFVLPEGVNLEGIKADLKSGVLQVEVPKRAVTPSKHIPIGRGAAAPEIEAGEKEKKKPEERKGEEQKQPKAA
ncbi:MAG: Hsp20/alpha crystallin family protein [Polyangiaceae bacterium]|nr:Hsp20/alpha crystallin family protein [Polyangiaceae bacterium]